MAESRITALLDAPRRDMPLVIPIVLSKPAFGKPCNGCGYCCRAEACRLSVEFLQSTVAPCVAIEVDDDGRTRCGLLANPTRYLAPNLANDPAAVAFGQHELSPKFAYLLRAGLGCDSDDAIVE